MKNFKKLLILTTVISSMAFGVGTPITPGTITNPGDDITKAAQVGDSAQAGVPMEVRVNVIGQGPQLVLVDETGTLIENLTFDHGNKLLAGGGTDGQINGGGQATDTYIPQESKVEKIVVLKRTDGKAFNADSTAANGVTEYTGNFIALSNNPADHGTGAGTDEELGKKTHQMTLTRLTATGTTEELHTMKTALDYESQDMTVAGTRNEIRTTVVSTIPQRTIAKPGLYIGTGTFIGRLTVKTLGTAN
jgi:hypothetical protein